MPDNREIMIQNKEIKLSFRDKENHKKMADVGVALSSVDRIAILSLIADKPLTLTEIAKELHIAASSVSYHVGILEQAGFLSMSYKPSKKGHIKLCCSELRDILFTYTSLKEESEGTKFVEKMPVGFFVDCSVSAPCGMADSKRRFSVDTPNEMYVGDRMGAQLLWFSAGKVSYRFPNHNNSAQNEIGRISVSFEACSEASAHRMDWPSDITVWINDVEVATYQSPSDFGGRRGRYTPKYWSINASQYGELKTFSVDEKGAYIDGQLVNTNVNINELHLEKKDFIKVSIGIKDDAVHVGGVNLFGEQFGDYPQDIVLTLSE